ETRKRTKAAGLDHEVMIAAPKLSSAILEHAQPSAFRAIVRRKLLEPEHALRHAVHRLVVHLGGEVVEEQHGRPPPREEVLERQDLTPIAQRALRQQADFGETVEDHAIGIVALKSLEDELRRFAKLEIGRVEQALLLFFVEQRLGRQQLENGHALE